MWTPTWAWRWPPWRTGGRDAGGRLRHRRPGIHRPGSRRPLACAWAPRSGGWTFGPTRRSGWWRATCRGGRLAGGRDGLRARGAHRRAGLDAVRGGRVLAGQRGRHPPRARRRRGGPGPAASFSSRRWWCSASTSRTAWTSAIRCARTASRMWTRRWPPSRWCSRRTAPGDRLHRDSSRRRVRPGIAALDRAPGGGAARRPFLLPAMGRGIFSPVYIDNLVDGIVAAAESDEAAGAVFTLTDGAGVEAREFFGHYARMLGLSRIRSLPTPVVVGLAGAASAGAAGRRGHARRGPLSGAPGDLLDRACPEHCSPTGPPSGWARAWTGPRPGCGPRGFWASRARGAGRSSAAGRSCSSRSRWPAAASPPTPPRCATRPAGGCGGPAWFGTPRRPRWRWRRS